MSEILANREAIGMTRAILACYHDILAYAGVLARTGFASCHRR